MEVLEIIGLLLAFGVILLIDKPKLDAIVNKKKYSTVYYSILAVGLVVGILEVFNLIPEFNGMLIDLYKKLSGA
jgi:hypothetical protein